MALLNGFGREAYPNLDSYEGSFKRGARHGAGTYYHYDGSRYEGEFEEGMMERTGKYFNSDNEVYEGEWHNSQRHGHGQFTYHDGTIYDGKWQADLRHGQGLMRYADGGVFSGNWANDRRHGQGQMTFADGGQYQGSWSEDQRHGYGSLKLGGGNASTYDGEFYEDIPEGKGTLYDSDEQSQYAGEFKAGLRSGEGKCEYLKTNIEKLSVNRNDKFVGQWLMGARARGLMFCANGEVERVGFLNDKLIRREKIPLQDQERLKCEAKGETYVPPVVVPKEPAKPAAVTTAVEPPVQEPSRSNSKAENRSDSKAGTAQEPSRSNSKTGPSEELPGPSEAVSA